MRVLLIDYSGHPFQVELARALAARGYQVCHAYSATFQTPKGELQKRWDDPPSFQIVGVSTAKPFAKDSFFKRRNQEAEIGSLFAIEIERFRPRIVLSSNAPVDTQKKIQAACGRVGAHFVFWLQDLYGEAILRILSAKLGRLGSLIGHYYRRRERKLLRQAAHVVAISEDFRSALEDADVNGENITIIENWAPLQSIDCFERDNEWARRNLPTARFRAVYSGTLGFKHNPELLLRLAEDLDGDVLVFSEGRAAESLKAQAEALGLRNLQVRGWLPFSVLPQALGSADLLVVLLERDAGMFSVPSKVLTYMCVARPILASIPKDNLAARIIEEVGAGLAVPPGDEANFLAAGRSLANDEALRRRMGESARSYAERTFDINAISSQFIGIFDNLTK